MKNTTDRRVSDSSTRSNTRNTRSKAVAKSWKDKDVAARRANKELGLPVGQHAKFRLELKDKQKATFRDEAGQKFAFRILKPKSTRNH
jgi:hypothetical protein